MADGWDLHAVVRGCTTAVSTATIPINTHINDTEDPLPDLASLAFKNDDTPFCYPGFAENTNFQFQGLEEIYSSFNSQPQPINHPNFSIPVLGNQQLPPPQQIQQQQLLQPRFKNSRAASSLPLPSFNSQNVRSRRRKNQLTKLVRQMTHEELLADSWAWRKYGQKPIKGSPYPRNYYRCSTSKGCAARKQVEKSPSDPNIYVVSYTGEHTHPRPIHRNSLAGSTRNKLSSPAPKPSEAPSAAAPNPSCSSSSPVSVSSFSSATPSMEGDSTQGETIEIEDDDDDDDDAEMEDIQDTENDEDLLIPNAVMSEDILKGFEELRQGFSGSLAPWNPNGSTTSSAAGGGH